LFSLGFLFSSQWSLPNPWEKFCPPSFSSTNPGGGGPPPKSPPPCIMFTGFSTPPFFTSFVPPFLNPLGVLFQHGWASWGPVLSRCGLLSMISLSFCKPAHWRGEILLPPSCCFSIFFLSASHLRPFPFWIYRITYFPVVVVLSFDLPPKPPSSTAWRSQWTTVNFFFPSFLTMCTPRRAIFCPRPLGLLPWPPLLPSFLIPGSGRASFPQGLTPVWTRFCLQVFFKASFLGFYSRDLPRNPPPTRLMCPLVATEIPPSTPRISFLPDPMLPLLCTSLLEVPTMPHVLKSPARFFSRSSPGHQNGSFSFFYRCWVPGKKHPWPTLALCQLASGRFWPPPGPLIKCRRFSLTSTSKTTPCSPIFSFKYPR